MKFTSSQTLPVFLTLGGTYATLIPHNAISPPSTSGSLTALKYTSVGGSGTYNQVTNMVKGSWPSCSANPSCITTPKQVSGALAPFDEELTAVLRGPMTLHNVAVYQPSNSSSATWKRTSSWKQGSKPDNLVFMNNKGGGASGEWDSEWYKRHSGDFSTDFLMVYSLWWRQPVLFQRCFY